MRDRNSQTSTSFLLSREELHRDAKALARRLLGFDPWKGIVAATRGLTPAAIFARALEIRLIETVCVMAYDPDDYRPQPATEGKRSLIPTLRWATAIG